MLSVGPMPAPAKSGSHSASRILLAIVSPLLVIALVALAATRPFYSYQTIQSTNLITLNETRLDLAHEQSAHRSAQTLRRVDSLPASRR